METASRKKIKTTNYSLISRREFDRIAAKVRSLKKRSSVLPIPSAQTADE